MEKKYYVTFSWNARNGVLKQSSGIAIVEMESSEEMLAEGALNHWRKEFAETTNDDLIENSVRIDFIFPLKA